MSLIEENIISHEEECFIRYPNMEMWLEKQGAEKFFFNPLQGVWNPDETLFRVFDIAS